MFFTRLKKYLHFLRSIFRVNVGLFRGMWKLAKITQPTITFFGGSRLSQEDPHSIIVCQLAKMLAKKGFSIITGGGPGIMEAANLGAVEYVNSKGKKKEEVVTMGIGVARIGGANKYVQEYIRLPYFFIRKWLLVRNAVGFIVGPGGFGTLDELAEVLTLIQTYHKQKTPIVLIGTKYWKPFLDWVERSPLKSGLLTEKDAALLNITDDAEEAYKMITIACTAESVSGIDAKPMEKKKK